MLEVGLILYSLHLGGDYEDRTPGIFLSHPSTGLVVGVVSNSFGNVGTFVSKRVWRHERWSINVGGITGYDWAPVMPLVTFNVEVTDNLTLSYIPPRRWGNEYGTITTTVTFR